jgi:hypothetical protein
LLGHPNRLLASQALQLLLLATHPDMYDWHSPPGHNSSSSSTGKYNQQQSSQNTEAGFATSQETPASSSQQLVSASAQVAAATKSTQDDSTPSHAVPPPAAAAAAAHPSQGPDGQLWLQLLQLHDGPLLQRLLTLSPDAWPGSGQQALQLLAFYLSWLRAWWCKVGCNWHDVTSSSEWQP